MKTISDKTHAKIKGYLEYFIENIVDTYKERKIESFHDPEKYTSRKSSGGNLKPFHAAILPKEIIRISAFERGFSTSLGSTFEECAKLIALDHHQEAKRNYEITKDVSISAIIEIEHQVSLFESAVDPGSPRPSFDAMIAKVMDSRKEDDQEKRSSRADLYVLANNGTEYYFELKSPKPNKGQCLEVLQRLLRFHLIKGGDSSDIRSYFAMAYNPYGASRDQYKWSFVKNYFPYDQALLIGNEFWNIIGGDTTQSELLQIYYEVGCEKTKYILDKLAFGF